MEKINYVDLKNENVTAEQLFDYIAQNYDYVELDNPELIEFNRTKFPTEPRTIHPAVKVPITLSGDYIFTQNDVEPGEDNTKLYCVYFSKNLKSLVEEKYSDGEVEDNSEFDEDAFPRIFLNEDNYILCSQIVDFIDYLLSVVPDPAIKRV
jgi:hypothetical protein